MEILEFQVKFWDLNTALIKNPSDDHESSPHPRADNADLTDGKKNVPSNNSEDVNITKTTLHEQGLKPAATIMQSNYLLLLLYYVLNYSPLTIILGYLISGC